MTHHLSRRTKEFQERFSRFAAEEIAGRDFLEFPMDVWRSMADKGLLGIGMPEEFGGYGGTSLDMLLAGEAFVQKGHNLGIALSWLIHVVVARFVIAGLANPEQKKRYLPMLASGKQTASLALSEPGIGNHPKHLKTSAEYRDGQWILNGEKAYLSNGTFADLYIVIAVTGEEGMKKEFSAFIVPADTPGLTRTEPLVLKVFKPSPHCGIKLVDCKLPPSNRLGDIGTAYRSIAIPFRDIEDLMLMGPILGAMERQKELLLQAIHSRGEPLQAEQMAELGWIQSFIHAVKSLSCEAAIMMDEESLHDSFTNLLLAAKALAEQYQGMVDHLFENAGLQETPEWRRLTDDLRFAVKLAANVRQIKAQKQGNLLLYKKEST
jgi:alkylation response protein AidB-like acyl-CoA dehydrogenase